MRKLFLTLVLIGLVTAAAKAQTTEFTYQGNLVNAGTPANGSYDFTFSLFDAVSGGTQLGDTSLLLGVAVANGAFTVMLNFGDQFTGGPRFLEINVRPAGGAFTTLTPRQRISSTPYAVKSMNSDNAGNAIQLGGVAASQFVLTGDIRLSNARDPLPGSSNYIQNTASTQPSSNFSISGNGIVGGTFSVGNSATSGRVFLNRASSSPSNSSDINFFSGGTPDFSLGTSQGSAPPSDFSIYNYGTGSNALTIQRSTGYFGLGTPMPNSHFHLKANAAQGFAMQMENASTTKRLFIGNYGTLGGGNHWPGFDSANTSFLYAENKLVFTAPDGIFLSGSTTAEHMRIQPSGNVGIGSSNPAAKLDVLGNAIFRTSGTNGVRITPGSDSDIGILNVTNAANTVNWLTVSNGSVFMDVPFGVLMGTTNRSTPAKLHVHGGLHVSGDRISVGNVLTGDTFTACWQVSETYGFYLGRCSTNLQGQQTQLDNQNKVIEEQRTVINSLVKTVCRLDPSAEVCAKNLDSK